MSIVAYLDEVGDPSLHVIDHDFPLFAVGMLVFNQVDYTTQAVPSMLSLKFDLWGHEAVIVHSRDIRRGEGPFAFLRNPIRRQPLYQRLNDIVSTTPARMLAVVVRKDAHRALHGARARDPYDLALRFSVERLVLLLEGSGQTVVRIIAEARGRKEDDTLRRHLVRLIRRGTSTMAASRFAAIDIQLVFAPKAMNVTGTQLADLMTYPVARHVLAPHQQNPAFEVVEAKLCRYSGERIGLAIYPPIVQEKTGGSHTIVQEPPADREMPSPL
jgi:hypothetical protein